MEIDLAAVGGFEEAEALLREDAHYPPRRGADGGLHVAPAAARVLFDLPLGGVEGVPDRHVEVLGLFVGDQLGAGNRNVQAHPVGAAFVVMVAGPLDGDAAARDPVE